ncbi:MAG: TonB-dependent receptor plug domain-containing protein, partial [Porticoccaceae bacterium]|nr:TonB-dependent receptor plug domain-containing protein [Porticoccaceae bacterium]
MSYQKSAIFQKTLLASAIAAALCTVPTVLYAAENEVEEAVEEKEADEEIVVSGSRIKRKEFSGATPIQVIKGQVARESGLIDTVELLQSVNAATGTQIDNTFTQFVLDNGPGSAQLNLRGLGATRTLIMVNSKRMSPGGVGGAPVSPDISTIPSIMIDRAEIVLDGASSVYGSDAVAGVVNIITRKDFDGIELGLDSVYTQDGGGAQSTLSVAWGDTYDKGSIGFGLEYYDRSVLRLDDRDFTNRCDRYLQIDENGVIRGDDLSLLAGTTINDCKLSTVNRLFVDGPVWGNIWATPGTTNIGIPGFSETGIGANTPLAGLNPTINPVTGIIDPDGNGLTEVDLKNSFFNYNGSARERAGDLISPVQRTNFYGYGDYNFGGEGNTTGYFELHYNKRESEIFSPGSTIFPEVSANNPFNPCNQETVDGTPGGQRINPDGANCYGFFGGANLGSQAVTPIIPVVGDRDFTSVELKQLQTTIGVKGDLPGWSSEGAFNNWSYDAYVSYSRADGTNERAGILEPQLLNSLNTSRRLPDGSVECDPLADGVACVPINMFAASLYQPGGGTFATEAERDYVFGVSSFDTVVEQTIVNAVIQGDLARLPWNDQSVPLVFGVEYRKDEIDSIPNAVARTGSLIATFQ